MIGKKFNRLTVISEVESEKKINKNNKKTTVPYYLCKCDCGKEKIVKGSRLRIGATKSCGCLYKETALSKIPKMIKASTIYDPVESLAVKVWKKHYDDDGLSFNDFMILNQQNCYYCNSQPYNHLKSKIATFSYNGLDRKDSSKGHTVDNCVPCCIICNRGKNNQEYHKAIEWMDRLSNNFNINKIIQIIPLDPPNKKLFKYVAPIYRGIKNRKTNLTLQEFYDLSQLNCYYCDGEASNKYGLFVYNGLDRVDSNFRYVHGNVVPCCRWCNSAKRNLELNKFSDWIYRLRDARKKERSRGHTK